MRLQELITYVRQLPPLGDDQPQRPGERPRRERDPEPLVPEGATLDVPADARISRYTSDPVLVIEGEFSLDDLPADVRVANPRTDVLAYYRPFHNYSSDWGIYLRESGILVAAAIMKDGRVSGGDSDVVSTARQLLLDHELFHFHAEVACARAEVVADRALYDAYSRDGAAVPHEEALANARAYMRLRKQPPELQERVRKWFEAQGSGYGDFLRWLGGKAFAAGCRLAAQYMLGVTSRYRSSTTKPGEFLFESMSRFRPPIYVVHDVSVVAVLRPFPKAFGMQLFVYTRDHPPPHVHLQIPPGTEFTRLHWPTLEPLDGDPPLSSDQRKALDAYLGEFGMDIDARVRAVYPGARPWVPLRR